MSSPAELARRNELVGVAREELVVEREVALPARVVRRELVELAQPERRTELRRLEVPRDVVEDEQAVVADPVQVLPEVALTAPGAEQLRLRPATPSSQRQAPVALGVVVEQDHATVAGARDDVRQREARDGDVGSRAGRRAPERGAERVAGVLDHREAVPIGDLPDAIPVRRVAGEVRHEDRLRRGPDHRFDPVDVDVEGVRLDVDEHRNQPGADQRCEIGGERQRRGDDLGAGGQVEQLDGEIQRG